MEQVPRQRQEYMRQYRMKNRLKLNEYQRGRYRADPIKANGSKRASRLKQRYGISLEQYDEMFQKQGGLCAICKLPPKKRRLDTDHDHKTGKVRGLLCGRCNMVLGLMNDESQLLLDSAAYLSQEKR